MNFSLTIVRTFSKTKAWAQVSGSYGNYVSTTSAKLINKLSRSSHTTVEEIRALARKTRQKKYMYLRKKEASSSLKYYEEFQQDDKREYKLKHSTIYYSCQLPKEDPTCERSLLMMVEDNHKHDEILRQLKKFSDLERYPSRSLLKTLVSLFASAGSEKGVQEIQRIAKKIYPVEYTSLLQYDHYLAEAYWKQGKHTDALHLFTLLHRNSTFMRRKIVNMSSFQMCHIFKNKLTDVYEHVMNFSNSCIQVGDYSPAANMWRWAFESKDFRAHELAKQLIDKHKHLKPLIVKKCPSVIKLAYEKSDIDILQRLIETVRQGEMSNMYSLVFGSLISFQCEIGDLKGMKTSLQYCVDLKISLPSSTTRIILALFNQYHEKIPESFLQLKYKYPPVSAPQLKW